jgi:pyrroloquinoline quinone biosynthesis protein B
MRTPSFLLLFLFLLPGLAKFVSAQPGVELLVLGQVQDGGSPHAGCRKACCRERMPDRRVCSLGLLDRDAGKAWLLEATPDIAMQMKDLSVARGDTARVPVDGILLTHAHIGHYSGLMFLGREAMGTKNVPVYAMPRMKKFLEGNGPWSQLVTLHNIGLVELQEDRAQPLSANVSITPWRVPHRDEFSETVGFLIQGPLKKALFIPDIDKWALWPRKLAEVLEEVDYAFLDGTFYDASEVGHRDIREIPHPLVTETMALLDPLPGAMRNKVVFIHLNHTNPLLNPNSPESLDVLRRGYRIARLGDRFSL